MAEMDVEAKIKSGHWVRSYDNFNIHQRVRHEREGLKYTCNLTTIHSH